MLRESPAGPFTRVEVARTWGGRALYRVSAYLVGDTLVDSGCPAAAGELVAWCRDRGVRRVVHTHHHEDHVGGDARLVRELGVEILAPALTVPILADFYRLPVYRGVVWGRPDGVAATPLGEEVLIGAYRCRVVPTPGHASDHVCFFSPDEGWMFTGDLYVSPRVRYLRSVEDAPTVLRSLRRLRKLRPDTLVCSHAGVVKNGSTALDRRIADWEGIARNARELAEMGWGLRRITRKLLGREGLMTWVSGGEFAKINLIRSLLGSEGGDQHHAVAEEVA